VVKSSGKESSYGHAALALRVSNRTPGYTENQSILFGLCFCVEFSAAVRETGWPRFLR